MVLFILIGTLLLSAYPHSAKIVIFIEYFVEICIVEGKKEICGLTCVSEKKENDSYEKKNW